MRRLMAILLVLTVVAAAGCTPGKKKKRGSGSSSNRDGAAAAPVGAGSTQSRKPTDLKSKVRAAVIPVEGLVPLGGPGETDEPDDEDTWRLGRVCDAELPTDKIGENFGIDRQWKNEKWWVNNLVTGNADVTAAEAIAAVKTAYGTCKKYTISGTQYTIVGPLNLGALPGVETTYAWTEKSTKTGNTGGGVCEAFLGRGQIVSWVTVEASTVDGAATACKQIAALAAQQLAAV
jgi:hypothetical protein